MALACQTDRGKPRPGDASSQCRGLAVSEAQHWHFFLNIDRAPSRIFLLKRSQFCGVRGVLIDKDIPIKWIADVERLPRRALEILDFFVDRFSISREQVRRGRLL